MGDHIATAEVPSGASTGSHEAHELRDRDENAWNGKGVRGAIAAVTDTIAPAMCGGRFDNIKDADSLMRNLDGTPNKARLGANAILGVSMVVARLLALHEHLSLHAYFRSLSPLFQSGPSSHPQILVNLINGGAHAGGGTSIQEFHILPRTGDLMEDLQLIHRFQNALKKKLHTQHVAAGTGDEGGYVLPGYTSEQALELLHAMKASLHIGSSLAFGLDIAAESFYNNRHYDIDGNHLTPSQYKDHIVKLAQRYHLALIEDPLSEDNFTGFAELKKRIPETLIIGDDLTVTNPSRLQEAIQKRSISGLIIKPNQIGSVSETLEVIQIAKQHHLHPIASHRSGETNDDFIIDLGVGTGCYGLKIGALQRGERIAKYNRLLEIYEHDNHTH
jgi:enolase